MEQALSGAAPRRGHIRGRVLTAAGRPVAGASVVVAAGPGPFPDLAAETGDDGDFALDGFAAGTYTLRALGPDGGQGETRATVHGAGTTTATIVLGGAASAEC